MQESTFAILIGRSLRLALLPLLALLTPVRSHAQEPASSDGSFDISRAWISDSTIFEPFHVTETRPLREALADGAVHEDTPLLVMEHEAGKLALLTEQMAYHHIAQGKMAGEPWMVSF